MARVKLQLLLAIFTAFMSEKYIVYICYMFFLNFSLYLFLSHFRTLKYLWQFKRVWNFKISLLYSVSRMLCHPIFNFCLMCLTSYNLLFSSRCKIQLLFLSHWCWLTDKVWLGSLELATSAVYFVGTLFCVHLRILRTSSDICITTDPKNIVSTIFCFLMLYCLVLS